MPNASTYKATGAAQRKPGLERCDGMLDKRELVRLATLAASSHNTQPWRFRIDDQTIMILPDYARRCPVVDPDDGHLLKSLGCAAENLAHVAAAQGHAAHVDFDSISAAVRIDVEVRRLRPQLHSLLGLKGETAQLMLRVGYGPEAPFSLRRPVEDVIIEG